MHYWICAQIIQAFCKDAGIENHPNIDYWFAKIIAETGNHLLSKTYWHSYIVLSAEDYKQNLLFRFETK